MDLYSAPSDDKLVDKVHFEDERLLEYTKEKLDRTFRHSRRIFIFASLPLFISVSLFVLVSFALMADRSLHHPRAVIGLGFILGFMILYGLSGLGLIYRSNLGRIMGMITFIILILKSVLLMIVSAHAPGWLILFFVLSFLVCLVNIYALMVIHAEKKLFGQDRILHRALVLARKEKK